MRHIRHYNEAPPTVKWKYSDTSKRLGIHSAVQTNREPDRCAKRQNWPPLREGRNDDTVPPAGQSHIRRL